MNLAASGSSVLFGFMGVEVATVSTALEHSGLSRRDFAEQVFPEFAVRRRRAHCRVAIDVVANQGDSGRPGSTRYGKMDSISCPAPCRRAYGVP
eukprot:16452393-Heterocapsa_arctica.AAC.2